MRARGLPTLVPVKVRGWTSKPALDHVLLGEGNASTQPVDIQAVPNRRFTEHDLQNVGELMTGDNRLTQVSPSLCVRKGRKDRLFPVQLWATGQPTPARQSSNSADEDGHHFLPKDAFHRGILCPLGAAILAPKGRVRNRDHSTTLNTSTFLVPDSSLYLF